MLVLDLEIWENGNNFTSDQFGDDTMNNESAEIIELKKKIEESVERVMHTPADFDFLSGAIWERIREYISPTTLKRTWGYLDGVKQILFDTGDPVQICRIQELGQLSGGTENFVGAEF